MPDVLVTGGSGFFGGLLKRQLLADGFAVTNIDLVPDPDRNPALTSIQGDLRNPACLAGVFAGHRFDAVFHCAAVLAHGRITDREIWSANVDGTRLLAETCRVAGVPKFIFISTNCLWAHNLGRPVREDDAPAPVETYGRSKLAAEQLLAGYSQAMEITILRSPTIISSGRLGLLAILFEFIHENRTVWVVGSGANRYQFIYAPDLVQACLAAFRSSAPDTFHVGSDRVQSLRDVYEAVIRTAGSRSRVRSLPKSPALSALHAAHALRISPLGPYHYKMIAEDFLFDTTRIKERLGWRPTFSNAEMLTEAYRYYAERRQEIEARTDVSAHSRPAEMGIVRLVKWLS
ncbi:MAG TPA: NAD(P)-dependent oxidoreductase [Acidobacteriaceae bacterium]|jgi:nucleoside-diphosphate-sugar epimerase